MTRFCTRAFVIVAAAATLAATLAAAQASPDIPAPPDVGAPPADAIKTSSGLATKVLTPGNSQDHPTMDDVVTVHYTAWTSNGRMFDSTVARGKPSTVGVWRMIPGFAEGLRLMVPGETRRMWIPEKLAYKGQRDPKGMLVFEAQLLAIPTHAPPDVKAPPPDAVKTASGLAYKTLSPGTGRHPWPGSRIIVQYTGWTTDGQMFDSSLIKGAAFVTPLSKVIPGWIEGLPLMVEGEKARFWIPEKLAYRGQSPPYGMLVFDIELLRVTPDK